MEFLRDIGRFEHLQTQKTVRAEEVLRPHEKRLSKEGGRTMFYTAFPLTNGDVVLTCEKTEAQMVCRREYLDREFAYLGD